MESIEAAGWETSRYVHPNTFMAAMKERVIGQKDLLPKLAYAFSHYTAFLDDPKAGKPLPLIYGPTGAGKTFAIEVCCEVSDLDITTIGGGGISPAGYKGTTLRDLISAHYLNFQKAEGVIFVDEIDKWCRGYIAQHEKPDPEVVSGNLSKQAEALRYMEKETINFLDEGKDLPSLVGESFDTSLSFWIFAGAFTGLDQVIRNRSGQEQIASDDIWEAAEPADFIKYGMLEEFANRIGAWAWVKTLTPHELLMILEAQDRPQWESLFDIMGCKLDLQSSALAAAANLASQNKRGPRGAKMYLKRVLGDVYTAAGEHEMTSVTVDAKVMVQGRLEID